MDLNYRCSYTLKTIDQTIKLLKQFTNDKSEWGCAELSRKLKWSTTKVHKILVSLRQGGMVEYDIDKRKYHLGIALFELAAIAIDQKGILGKSYPYLHKMASETGFAATLAVLDGVDIVYIDTVEAKTNIQLKARTGTRSPAYATSIGKAILALLPNDLLVNALLKTEFQSYTPFTITSIEKLKEQLPRIRKTGYAINNQESSIGVIAVGAAIVDFMGRPIGGISLGWPIFILKEDTKIHELGTIVKFYAGKISRDLGTQGKNK